MGVIPVISHFLSPISKPPKYLFHPFSHHRHYQHPSASYRSDLEVYEGSLIGLSFTLAPPQFTPHWIMPLPSSTLVSGFPMPSRYKILPDLGPYLSSLTPGHSPPCSSCSPTLQSSWYVINIQHVCSMNEGNISTVSKLTAPEAMRCAPSGQKPSGPP